MKPPVPAWMWTTISVAAMVLWLGWLLAGDVARSTSCLGVALGALSLAHHAEAGR